MNYKLKFIRLLSLSCRQLAIWKIKFDYGCSKHGKRCSPAGTYPPDELSLTHTSSLWPLQNASSTNRLIPNNSSKASMSTLSTCFVSSTLQTFSTTAMRGSCEASLLGLNNETTKTMQRSLIRNAEFHFFSL